MQTRSLLLCAAAVVLLASAAEASRLLSEPALASAGRRLAQNSLNFMRADIKAADPYYTNRVTPTVRQAPPGVVVVPLPSIGNRDPSEDKKRAAKEAAYQSFRPYGWSAPELGEDVEDGASDDALEAPAPKVSWVSFSWGGVETWGKKRH
ncbi:hypothetical protein MNEG_10380 [Monoraphidium neglectum]|jgi:hypothetical protein|uniref:Uncharacterized protein n=1 Tax=Monoraphidium neglectum TaxID=145388 RepID=A0A0D2M993_9CHLO|nr:hypothetical protein MNEG_10380 [Monoraphidium neglectum]KIY97581.1 hypothetical protein MNEG_10380 [Monoraphidium neglectum]|eukprot:XP_013896601.1 hypothetical protein MNEG_10380 [Monoraphidium neglectum]